MLKGVKSIAKLYNVLNIITCKYTFYKSIAKLYNVLNIITCKNNILNMLVYLIYDIV